MVNELVHVVKCSPRRAISVEKQESTTGDTGEAAKEKGRKEASDRGKKDTPKTDVTLICPKCGKAPVVKGRTAWGCKAYGKGCDFLIPIEYEGKKLTQKQVEALVQKGRTGNLSGFISANGEKYGGFLYLDENKRLVLERKNNSPADKAE